MPKSLADGHIKLAILTTEPENPAAPTVAELEAGIGGARGAACRVLASDFAFGATDSDKVAEKALCDTSNANALGASNFQAGITPFRFFNEDGAPDPIEDDLFEAIKVKGTSLWMYARKTGKEETEPWAAADELYQGMEVLTDTPQPPSDLGGYIKYRAPLEPQRGWPFITVGPVAP